MRLRDRVALVAGGAPGLGAGSEDARTVTDRWISVYGGITLRGG
jgi:hypothetical protein